MGVISYIRQSLFDTHQFTAARAIYEKNPTGSARPGESPTMAALAPALRREVPVVFIADSELMMRRAMAIAREFNLKYILSGARQAYRMPADLKDVPVLVSVKWPAAPAAKEDREEQPLRLIRERQFDPTSPAVLQNYAHHHRTGAPLPRELLQKVIAAAKFNQFFARLVETIANTSERPQRKSTSKMAPRK